MSRGDQLHRQWSILNLLAEGRKSRRELAHQLGVSLKTITRDIQALSIFPIAEQRDGIDVLYHLMRGFQPPSVRFEPDEIAALLIGKRSLLGALEGSPHVDAVAAALTKIELLQRDRTYRARRDLPDVFHSSFAKPSIRTPFQEQLLQAAIERRLVWMRYFTAERQQCSERTVEPLFVHLHPHGFHLIAYCLEKHKFLYFSINCIRELRVLDDVFDPAQRSFQLEKFLATVFDGHRANPVIDVWLRVRNPTAYWARDRFYHATQHIRDIDGGVEIRFRSGAPDAIAARVLSLGPDCEVVEPASLRQIVAEKALEISKLYRQAKNLPDPGPDVSRVDASPRFASPARADDARDDAEEV